MSQQTESSASLVATGQLPPGYPREWEADVVLRDGTVAHVRPITPADGPGVREFHAGQSDESIYLRFFAPVRELSDRDIERFTVIDYQERVALVATLQDKIVGIGRYDTVDDTTAEVAFNISDHLQGKGIGSVLLEHLAVIGYERGITRFVADVLPQNRKMLNVFKEAGYAVKHRLEDGVISLSFRIVPTAASTAVRIAREHRSESLSVRGVLTPASVAVVGTSRRSNSIGHTFLKNILDGGFTGQVYAVNPHASDLLGLRCYPSLTDIPGRLDLVVLAVPAPQVIDLVDECAAKGAKAILVPSAHFAEEGESGWQLQSELRKRARRAGLRVVGPNSFGIINNHGDVRLNASLAPKLPPLGTLGLFAQSGALGIAVLGSAARRGLGVSAFASAGNRVDVSGNDMLQYWIDDDATDAVGLYIESTGNPRKFSRIARNLAATKPVMVVKSGAQPLGGSPGHAVRNPIVRDEAFEAMLRQSGCIRAENIHQLFDIAQLVTYQPLPQGNRVAVVTNSDALASLSAQSAVSWGLQVTHGPVALSPEASIEEYAVALEQAFGDPDVDSVVTSFIPPVYVDDRKITAAIRDTSSKREKPCVANFLGLRGVREELQTVAIDGVRRRVVPAYALPEDAVRALAAATMYATWRARDKGVPLVPDGIDRATAQSIIDEALADGGRSLTKEETRALLAAYGIILWPVEVVETADEAVAAAERQGYPVILKTASRLLRHQVGISGVRPDLAHADTVRDAFATLSERLGSFGDGLFAVQSMSPPGVACVVASTEDPLFGPVVSFSVAGPPTELLNDIGYRIPPLTDVDVRELVESVRASPLLTGHKGQDPVHLAALHDLIGRIAVMADEHPALASVRLEPVNCWAAGVDVLGAEIAVHPPLTRKDASRRAMT
ncbi:MAG: multidrug ABC transporter permease [Actinomycetales bacterium]|nr:MAG: multidrug ABC transporter permease [Actinomycetales bacterium]